jgi:hypothetical protein
MLLSMSNMKIGNSNGEIHSIQRYTGWSKKKFMMWSKGKVFEKF